MPAKNNYLRIGLFILSGAALIIAAVIVLGASSLFDRTIPAETYFNESVQGLDPGAAVKYRGVKIGTVSRIGFVKTVYPQAEGDTARYVYVQMAIDQGALDQFEHNGNMRSNLDQAIKQGFRIRLTTQGLTGVSYLEMNFLDAKNNPVLPLDWNPENMYIPSAPSTISKLQAAFNDISDALKSFKKVNFQKLADNLDSLIGQIDTVLKEAKVKDLGDLVAQNLVELKTTLQSVNTILNQPGADQIIPDTAATMASARNILESSQQDVITLVANMRVASNNLANATASAKQILNDPELKKGVKRLPETMEHIEKAAFEIRKSAVHLDRMLRALEGLVASQRGNVDQLLDEAGRATQNLNEFILDTRRNPSRLIFGQPPNPVDVENLSPENPSGLDASPNTPEEGKEKK